MHLAMAYDRERDMVYLGAYDQNIYIYDISVNPPVMREAIAGENGSVQSLHYAPNVSPENLPVRTNYLFAVCWRPHTRLDRMRCL